MKRRVVVTGVGVISPIGNSAKELWSNLKSGVSGVDKLTRFDASAYSTSIAAEVKDFDPSGYIDKKEARRMDLTEQYAIVSAQQAFDDAELSSDSLNLERAGVVVGSGIGGIDTFEKQHAILLKSLFHSHDDHRHGRRFGLHAVQL
jgi:3-oxoacyl-[acyl-carrier-protein] synthase II